jgi:PAS domain S-box-containing protein
VEEKGKGWTNELTCLTKSGRRIFCELAAAVMEFGVNQFLVFFVCDHSARKKAEQAFADSENRFHLTLNNINDAVFYADLSGKILWVNQQAARLFGRPLEDLIGSLLMECLSPEAAALAESRLASIRAGASVPSLVEFKVIRPDGSARWIEANVSNVTQDEMVVGRLLVGRDITDRRLAEEKFQLVFEKTAPCGMVMVDDSGIIVLTNYVSEQIFGYEHGAMEGQPVERLIPERFRSPHLEHRLKFSSDPHPRAMENRQEFYGLRKDGTEFPLEIALNPLTTSEGPFVLATLLDVTERKQMAEQLLEEAKLAEVGRIIGDISHDMKNMLMPILNGAKLMEEELQEHYATLTNVNQKQVEASKNFTKEAIDMIVNNARRIHDRVREIADTVKGATSPFNIAPCHVSSIAEGVFDSLRFYAADKGVSLQVKGLDTLPLIHGDHSRLFNALYNLVNNAIPETPVGGSVTIVGSVGSEATTVVISVADTGGGMPPEIRERLFTKEAISGKPGGTGLGTKIIKDVVDAHGGTITVESEQGKGTTFTMELPIHCQRG